MATRPRILSALVLALRFYHLSHPPMPRPDRFLRACRGEAVDATPVWFMRQAGRYMDVYQALRKKYELLELVKTPELAAEVTLQPLDAFDVDAAIIFSDLLPPLEDMGVPLRFVKGRGPVLDEPVRTPADVEALRTPPAAEALSFTLDAIKILRPELDSRGLPLIGFAGAPFTLASYAIEGGGSRKYEVTKRFMYTEPEAWHLLMQKLVTVSVDFLLEQAKAGAQALQVFDSWAGALGREDYRRFVLPHTTALMSQVAQAGVPIISFSTGTGAYVEVIKEAGGDVLAVDGQLPLDAVHERIGSIPLQGNIDPILLQAPWSVVEEAATSVLDRAPATGHIFNVGTGLVPQTPVDAVKRLTDFVHTYTETHTTSPAL